MIVSLSICDIRIKGLYMNMNMYIVMNMNIYISKDNEEYLKTIDGSMSGLINELLYKHRGINVSTYNLRPTPAKDKTKDSVAVSSKTEDKYLPEVVSSMARACCLNKVKPCKHWNWTGDSYVNILTGEIREVDA